MALDEQLRQLADEVPAPPPGDASAAFRRGVRRRRSRRTVGVVAAVVVVAVLGVGTASLVEGPTALDIAERPPAPNEPRDDGVTALPEDWPVIVEPPALTVSSEEPEWAVAVSVGEDGQWCVTAVRGSTQVTDVVGDPCDQLLTPEQVGDPDGFGTGGWEVEATQYGAPAQGLSWGFAPATADEVVVLFTDGTRTHAPLGSDGSLKLWAIGYEGVEVQAVEARRAGEVIAGSISTTSIADDGIVASPQAAYGARVQRQDVEAFTDEQQRLLDLRTTDDLFLLPIGGTDRSVGIRARDGSPPLMFATACDLLDQVELPNGWTGICLEYTDPEEGRVRGLFPHGTTSGS